MKFPDRPIATAGLGIACALVLLAILSWPTLLAQTTPTFNAVATNAVTQSSTAESTFAMPNVSSPASLSVAASSTTRPPSINTASGSALSSTAGGTQVNMASTITSENQSLAETTVASATTVFIQTTKPVSSASSPEDYLFAYSSLSSNVWGDVALLSIVSLGIALASAFFIHRKVNSEK